MNQLAICRWPSPLYLIKNRVVPHDMVILGEDWMTGNVRSIPRIEQRINEAKKLGFTKLLSQKETINKLSTMISLFKSAVLRPLHKRCNLYSPNCFFVHSRLIQTIYTLSI